MNRMLTLMLTAVCGAAIAVAVAAQGRGPAPGGPQGPLVSSLDADRDGVISSAEMLAAPSALQALDANGDGRLTLEELRPGPGRDGERGAFGGRRGRGEGAEGRGAPADTPDDLAATLMGFDRNGDAKLARAEVPDRFQGLFDRADADKDGALTADELKQSASSGTRGDAPEGRRGGRGGGDALVRALDADRDGSLSPEEIGRAADALKTLDTNGDGRLSVEEYRQRPMGGRGRRGLRWL